MDKLKMHSADKVNEHIEQIAALFPNCITEKIVGYKDEVRSDNTREPIVQRAIDFDVLRQELSDIVVEGPTERYQFTWPDKRKSILAANAPIAKTLRPCREESVDFDATENLYIEGDNLDALKLLQETYLGKVKMIYIDPPYNTGNDFVYEDDFAESAEEYMDRSGDYDEEGNRLVKNADSNGRFHTDWLNMVYPRLKLAKDLLSDDGVIFISIDDNEIENLKKICNELFGNDNFMASFMWKRKKEISSDSRNVAIQGEHILCYTKNYNAQLLFEPISQNYIDKTYNDPTNEFPEGKWRPVPITVSKGLSGGGYTYTIKTPTGAQHTRLWAYPQSGYERLLRAKRIYFGKEKNSIPQRVIYAHESKGQPISNYWDDVATNKEGKKELLDLFTDNIFDTPKPISLITKMLKVSTNKSSIVLDFFSGSATTAHAVMQLNAEDGGNRKFIMVQLPEETDEKSEAYKAGYKNICEIGKERIRRAGQKIKKETEMKAPDLDVGFRVLKVDSTNMKDVYYSPAEIQQTSLHALADNIKPDRTAADLLFQVMLDLGVLLSSKIEQTEIAGKTVFSVAGGHLLACFDIDVTDEVVAQIAKQKPYYFVMRDGSLASDAVATNFEQIFTTYSPTTVRKVL